MKINKKHLYLSYYIIVLVVLTVQTIYTIYQTSIVVAYGKKQKKLEINQQQLLTQKQTLEEKLAKETSLISTLDHDQQLASYQPISHPLVLSNYSNLAAAN